MKIIILLAAALYIGYLLGRKSNKKKAEEPKDYMDREIIDVEFTDNREEDTF